MQTRDNDRKGHIPSILQDEIAQLALVGFTNENQMLTDRTKILADGFIWLGPEGTGQITDSDEIGLGGVEMGLSDEKSISRSRDFRHPAVTGHVSDLTSDHAGQNNDAFQDAVVRIAGKGLT